MPSIVCDTGSEKTSGCQDLRIPCASVTAVAEKCFRSLIEWDALGDLKAVTTEILRILQVRILERGFAVGKDTSIQWADSSLNLQAGCDGCELWNSRVRKCYAGRMIDGGNGSNGYRGLKGWPASFNKPELFLDRLEPALKWKDLTGTERKDKPWLNGLPRIIFLNDMGDTFSKLLPANWMAPILPRLAESPHQFLILTKRPSRLADFAKQYPLPKNVWPGTTITDDASAFRADHLRSIKSGGPKFLSVEPIWGHIPCLTFREIPWVIIGGESGDSDVTPTNLDWIATAMMNARNAGAAVFVKQLGSNAYFHSSGLKKVYDEEHKVPFETNDSHGGEWNEWPMAFRERHMPKIEVQGVLL